MKISKKNKNSIQKGKVKILDPDFGRDLLSGEGAGLMSREQYSELENLSKKQSQLNSSKTTTETVILSKRNIQRK